MAAAKFSSYRPTSKLWASFCSSLGEAWLRPALCTAARSHAATHGRQIRCWAASGCCASWRTMRSRLSLQRPLNHSPAIAVLYSPSRPTKHGLPDATTYSADAEYAASSFVLNSHLHTAAACMFASVRCSCAKPVDGFSLGCPPWRGRTVGRDLAAPGLPSSYWPLPTSKSEQTKRRAAGDEGKNLPQKVVGRRQSPLLVRAG